MDGVITLRTSAPSCTSVEVLSVLPVVQVPASPFSKSLSIIIGPASPWSGVGDGADATAVAVRVGRPGRAVRVAVGATCVGVRVARPARRVGVAVAALEAGLAIWTWLKAAVASPEFESAYRPQ